jgi:hypothetical protein
MFEHENLTSERLCVVTIFPAGRFSKRADWSSATPKAGVVHLHLFPEFYSKIVGPVHLSES